jgi:hypothetical protein
MRTIASMSIAILTVVGLSFGTARISETSKSQVGVPGVMSAHAAACWDTGCDGKDAAAYGCTSDLIHERVQAVWNPYPSQAGTIYLDYSPSCGAAWNFTGAWYPDNGNCSSSLPCYLWIYRYVSGGYLTGSYSLTLTSRVNARTLMVGDASSSEYAKACSAAPGGAAWCTTTF